MDQFSFTPVDHDPFSDLKNYANSIEGPVDQPTYTGGPMPEFSDEISKQNWINSHTTYHQNVDDKSYTGGILPFEISPEGKPSFNSDVGLLGAAKHAFMLPGDVATGKIDPNSTEAIQRSTDLAGMLAAPALHGVPEPDTLGIFAGAGAKTSNKLRLLDAVENHEEGLDPRTNLENTGWFQGPDKGWRWEISDDRAELHPAITKALADPNSNPDIQYSSRLGNVLNHPELFKAYPELKDYRVSFSHDPNTPYSGEFDPNTKTISVKSNILESNETTNPKTHADPMDILLHELQHAVQDKESFDPGSNPEYWEKLIRKTNPDLPDTDVRKQARTSYRSNAGEVEARNVTGRRFMEPDVRRYDVPWDTQDTPNEKQVFMPGRAIRLSTIDHDPFTNMTSEQK